MAVRIAVNGLGRIGRLFLRQAIKNPLIQVVAVNDLVPADNLAYLLQYDSTHGEIDVEVRSEGDTLRVAQQAIVVCNEKDPTALPWRKLGVDYVVESTGHFTTVAGALLHLQAGAKRVLITAPSKTKEMPTFVMGVNQERYDPRIHTILSNASCTTNCLALITKVLLDHFGIEEGLMTTIHALTATQPVVDGYSKKDWRGGRGAHQNIIPASTGAAAAVALCLPQVKGKLTGMAFRVPVVDVSVVDLVVRLSTATSYQEICHKMEEAANGPMKGLLRYCAEEAVSSDFISSTASAIFDAGAGIELNDRFFKLIAWYDNEMGYASRVLDMLLYMATQE